MPQFNIPSPDDPDYKSKVHTLLKELYESQDRNVKDFTPIKTPEEGLQIGSIWFDSAEHKFKVNTPDGVKTLKYE